MIPLNFFWEAFKVMKILFSECAAWEDVGPAPDRLVGLLRDVEWAGPFVQRGQRGRHRLQGENSRLRETEQCGPGHGKDG